jgi:SAM-dependent methyltransferase
MSASNNLLDAVNKRTYANAKVVRCYEQLDFIQAAEQVIFDRLRPQIEDKKLLDIGIGGGRTTRFLLEISSNYTGIDYTQASIDAAKIKFPQADLRCLDARDLSSFDNETFSLVLFSFNGIDYMGHDDRLRTLAEIRRVLRPEGYFVFSTHNRDYRFFNKHPWQQDVQFDLKFLKSCLYSTLFLPRHARMRKLEVHDNDYDIINDNAHEFSLLTYYIGIEQQKRQLQESGFKNVEAFDMSGNVVAADDQFPWTYYLSQKANV